MNDANHAFAEVVGIAQQCSQALVRKDAEALEQFLAADFTYTTASGDVLDRASYLKRFVCAPEVTWEQQRLNDITPKPIGAYVAVTCKVHNIAWVGGTRLDGRFLSTYLYARMETGWQCIAGQTGPNPPSGPVVPVHVEESRPAASSGHSAAHGVRR